jgi:hypothetical protein
VREAFLQEQPRLLPLPANVFPTEERVEVKVGKTPYVRFDLNDYSVPHTQVQRLLTVMASPQAVRILDGATVIARHPRSYDRGGQIEDAAHLAELVARKRAARVHRGQDRLAQAAPNSRELLVAAAARGENRGSLTAALLRLLDAYGASELQVAIQEALANGVPHPNAVRLSLERRREQRELPPPLPLRVRAKALKLHGLLAHGQDIATTPWVAPLIAWEEDERARRGLERRLSNAHLGRFKPLADFDWHWPTQCDRTAIEDLMGLRFLGEAANVVLVGPNGVGKTLIARNIAHQAVLAGHTVLFTSAGHLLNELAGADGDNALRHRLSVYARPRLLVVDEVG